MLPTLVSSWSSSIVSVVRPFLLASFLLAFIIDRTNAIPRKLLPRQNSTDQPCAVIFDSNYALFTAKLAYDCLISAPFNATIALEFLDYYNDTLQFHSTLELLKSPPPSYQQPPLDLPASLASIKERVQAGAFPNEYEFEVAVQEVVYATHDAHVTLSAGILGAFVFFSPLGIVSASTDGIALPKIYITDDILEAVDQNVDWVPSPVSNINGNDTIEFLTQFAAINGQGNIEPHGDWNQLMSSPASDVQGLSSTFEGSSIFYPGENITFNFENGSTTGSLPWLAFYSDLIIDSPPILSSGVDLYNYFVLGIAPPASAATATSSSLPGAAATSSSPPAATTSEPASSAPASTTSDATATLSYWDFSYPSPTFPPFPTDPVVSQPNLGDLNGGIVTGYFLNDGVTAVLSIPSFFVTAEAVKTFSSTIGDFLAKSTAAGLTRFIVDLQGNGGGSDLLATDAFRQFFPSIDPFSGSRLRAHPAADALGNTLTTFYTTQSIDDVVLFGALSADAWVATVYLDAATGQNFTSWPDFFGPHPYSNDLFTTTQRNNLSSIIFDENATGDVATDGIVVYGFGNRSATSAQPYPAEQIVILTDATCSSACAIFVELMHHQAGVRTVVAGGRPEPGPMQAVGGSRGAESYDTVSLDLDIVFAEIVNTSVADVLPNRTAGNYVNYATFNLKDAVRQGEDLPLQFNYEAATCRIFYTTRTVYNYLNLWNYVVDAIWRNPSLCIAGSANGTAIETSTDTTGPAINDKAVLAGPDANIPHLILSGLQSGPQNPTYRRAKRDASSPPPPPTPEIPDNISLPHINNDGLIGVSDCSVCASYKGFSCVAVPSCNQGKITTTQQCLRTCTRTLNSCNKNTQTCSFTGASGFCQDVKASNSVKQCKTPTKNAPSQQTRAIGDGNNHLPYPIKNKPFRRAPGRA